VSAFRPSVALLLNVTPDHLDRYDGMADYAAAKGNAFRNQQSSDWAVVPFANPVCEAQAARGKAATVSFGAQGHVRVEGDVIVDTRDNARYLLSECSLQGRHNAMNMAAAIAVAPRLHATPEVVRRVLSSFEGLPHRMTFVRTVAGVRYYDDSKGTNEGASVTALLGLAESKVVLIAGGKDKGGGYAALADALACKGRAVILLGEAAPLIEAALGQRIKSVHAKTMEEAVLLARRHAQEGDAVLLSPACSSFDMYRDYKERGDVFVHAVRALVDGTSDSEATVPSGASAPAGRQA
jgi:UDP-N-acetylmuramoylalanine--D-glutamate ligase